MNRTNALLGDSRILALGLILCAAGRSLTGAEVSLTRTNWVERWITNVIDVRIPVNSFVNEYRTNWVTAVRTNIVDVYATNWTMRTLTNQVAVNLVRTNRVDHYHTNWETVVVLKTNWLTRTVTNVMQVDPPSRSTTAAPAPKKVAEPQEALIETTFPASAGTWTGPLAIEAVRTSQQSVNNLVEVRMRVRWTGDSTAPLQVQQWRVEREDSAVLLFGQEQEFKRQLLAGKYKVEAKLKPEGNNPPVSVRGTLSLTPRDAVVQPRLLVRK